MCRACMLSDADDRVVTVGQRRKTAGYGTNVTVTDTAVVVARWCDSGREMTQHHLERAVPLHLTS